MNTLLPKLLKCECCKQEVTENYCYVDEINFNGDVLCDSCYKKCSMLISNPSNFKYISNHIDYVRKVLARGE